MSLEIRSELRKLGRSSQRRKYRVLGFRIPQFLQVHLGSRTPANPAVHPFEAAGKNDPVSNIKRNFTEKVNLLCPGESSEGVIWHLNYEKITDGKLFHFNGRYVNFTVAKETMGIYTCFEVANETTPVYSEGILAIHDNDWD
ncbi:hypothetical protein HELRODRAFT_163620 [Helobdella robusta]|uniref:Uncharacterized protein n=1 Tax=Helobdella robusta TaxID=6412 RepID=T1EUA4_HELRO|nr:hypothetical protein HELRODRAFT_163620 [Helobdella robusta]ESN96546.1 hypothetical protein HELRODRAFT_163620 [Helobdella robusta]